MIAFSRTRNMATALKSMSATVASHMNSASARGAGADDKPMNPAELGQYIADLERGKTAALTLAACIEETLELAKLELLEASR